MRFKLTLEYAGTRYSGWQVQQNAKTVQGELERAIREATGSSDFEVYGSGRTDAGVHALAQIAHLDVRTSLPPDSLRRRINDGLPADINVLRLEPVRHRFHARHSAIGRSYVYQVARRRSAFAKAFVWWVKDDLDVGRMREAARLIVGFHDFRAFSDDDPTEKSTEVQVESLEILEDGDLLLIRIEGSHFIWKMVRRLVGVLVEIGRGAWTPEDIDRLLRPSPTGAPGRGADGKSVARVTAPASGLFLESVYYEGEPRQRPPSPTRLPRPA